ncbi:hypothetical protein [Lentibacillus amyloliquefaciens]|uniref:DUF5683 domain-containing protein n=1 Tax=Lentibacillus amyloliquefaciens TaxID=1472767 RepID=A0A0U4G4E3_9BACI|nr:hypothetical protein [Lentibacillus amyloliquefaciens]ALX47514.1 hypothetical protein AOX59_02190 [Lentibacillus amyloliquefaciens]
MKTSNQDKNEKLLWSIALPGFGQLLNRQYIKGILLIALEFLVNVQANFNEIILLSFFGETQEAVQQTKYGWLMFYPCLYFFAMWDTYKEAGGGKELYSFLPFVFSAYFVTVGTIYSSKLTLFGVLLGPIWLPILSVIPGVGIGVLLKNLLKTRVR